jgi:3-isopropylmalate/(R)-2-methylmalate dehydratase small subunit
MTIDLTKETIHLGSDEFPASILSTARDALINGRWDPIAELLEAHASVEERVGQMSYMAPG